MAEQLAQQSHRLERAARFQLLQARQRLTRLPVSRAEGRMASLLHRLEQRLDDLSFRAEAAVSSEIRGLHKHVIELTAAVLSHDPRQSLSQARERLTACRTRLDRTLERKLNESSAHYSALDARLHSLSPLAVLDRGYALVLNANGGVVRSTLQVTPGDRVMTRLSDGAFISRVESAATTKK
jgi:exodeoxyribonuclease VII large subunit